MHLALELQSDLIEISNLKLNPIFKNIITTEMRDIENSE